MSSLNLKQNFSYPRPLDTHITAKSGSTFLNLLPTPTRLVLLPTFSDSTFRQTSFQGGYLGGVGKASARLWSPVHSLSWRSLDLLCQTFQRLLVAWYISLLSRNLPLDLQVSRAVYLGGVGRASARLLSPARPRSCPLNLPFLSSYQRLLAWYFSVHPRTSLFFGQKLLVYQGGYLGGVGRASARLLSPARPLNSATSRWNRCISPAAWSRDARDWIWSTRRCQDSLEELRVRVLADVCSPGTLS